MAARRPGVPRKALLLTTLLAVAMTVAALALFVAAVLSIEPANGLAAPAVAQVESARAANDAQPASERIDEPMTWVAAIAIGFVGTLALLLAGLNERARRREREAHPLEVLAKRVCAARGAAGHDAPSPASLLDAKVARAQARLAIEREWHQRVREELEVV